MSKAPAAAMRASEAGLLAAILVMLALALAPTPSGAEGLPVIDFVSPGGVVSDLYVVNVTVIGDLAPGQVFFGVDEPDPDTAMTPKGQYHYEATVDASALTEGDHTITVKAINTTGANVTRAQTITVDHSSPVVEVTSTVPEYVIGEYTLTATVDDLHVDTDNVKLVLDGNTSDAWSMTDAGDHFAYVLDSTELMCGPHVARVYAYDLGGNRGWSEEVTLQVDNCAPMVMFLSEGGHAHGIYVLRVEVTDPYMDADEVWGVFDGDNINKTALDFEGDGVYTFSFDTTTMPDGDHEITVVATDLVGFTVEGGPLVLMVDNAPPVCRILNEGGNVTGYYTVEATVTDAYLNTSAVYVVVDDYYDEAIAMVWAGDRFEAAFDTRNLMDGIRTLRVWAFDDWGQESHSPPLSLNVDNNAPYVMILTDGGQRWGNYQVRANVTDPNLDTSCVKVKVGDAEPVQMKASDEYWYYNVDTTKLSEGPVTLTIMACDTRGNRNELESVTITVANRAELEIVSVDWVDTTVPEGGVAKVQVRVRNAGHTTAKGFRVELTSGGESLAYSDELTGIIPGKEHTYTLEWRAKGTGTRSVRIAIDTTDVIPETDETNNQWETQTLNITEEGSSVPGMGALLAVAVMLGAAGILRVHVARHHKS